MKSKIVVSMIICVLAVLLILKLSGLIEFASIKVYKYPTSGQSEIALSSAITSYINGEIPNVDLSAITTFSWDRVYIFGPYTELSKIDAVAGKSWRSSCFTTISSTDGFSLIVFIENNRSVGCIEYPRDQGDFASLEKYVSGFSVEEAHFILDERGKMVWTGNK